MESIDLVNLLFPEHSRTSCSDDDISNGFYFESDVWSDYSDRLSKKYVPRCQRCDALEIVNGKVKLTEENKKIITKYFY